MSDSRFSGMTLQEEKIYKGYVKLLKFIEENPDCERKSNELIAKFHRDIEMWDGVTDIEFINDYLQHENLCEIAADPKTALDIFPGMEDEYIRFMNNSTTKQKLRNLFKLRKENKELLAGGNKSKFSNLNVELMENSIMKYLDECKLSVKPRALVERIYIILFPELSTTIAVYEKLKATLLFLKEDKAVIGSVESMQWQIRFLTDSFLIKYELFDDNSLWFRAAIAWFILDK